MKNCPNCGALISDDQTNCSICNTPINNELPQNNNNNNNQPQPNIIINSLNNNQAPVEKVYQPLPEINNEEENKVSTEEVQTIINNSNKPSDEEKKNVMGNILKEHEEKNKKEKKDDTFKAVLLSIFVVLIIVVGGYFAVNYGFTHVSDGKEKILNQVKDQANNYTTIVKDYMKKYDYKTNSTNLNGYYAKSRTFNFLSLPLTSKCVYSDGIWTGADDDEISCSKFFNDINNNYCQAVPCSIPSAAEIYLKETYENMTVNGNEETITTGTILDGTILTYDDVKCSLSNNNYTCEYIEKQE